MFRAENLKRYKGKSSDCGTQSGLFSTLSFLQTVLHSTSPSSREIPRILCSAEIVPQGKMPKIRMAEGSTPESGGRRCLRGEMSKKRNITSKL